MRHPAALLVSFAVLVSGLVAPAVAPAQSRTGLGSPLTATPNYPYHCDWRWAPGAFGPGGAQQYEPTYIGPSTCSIGMIGLSGRPETSHLVPATGTVTVARVKSGPNPAPISIATVRSFQGRDQQGKYSDTCCQGVSETPTITPTPNAITEIPVNFRVEAKLFDPNTGQAGWWDYVVVNVHGSSGTLPIYNNGEPKPLTASATPAPNDYQTFWHFPQIDPSQHNMNRWTAPGFEVLMNYDWCPGATAARARAAQACATQGSPAAGGGTPGAGGTPGGGGGPAAGGPGGTGPRAGNAAKLASVRSSKLTLSGSSVAIRVRCAATSTCKGKVRLRTRARKPRTLGSKSIRIKAGKTATVKVRMSKRNRAKVKRRGLKVAVEVDLGTNGKVTRNVTLRRTRG